MDYFYFVGIDISKEWLDAALIHVDFPRTVKHCRIENSKKGFKALIKWISQQGVQNLSHAFFCMEHSGVYAIPLCEFLGEQEIVYTLVPGMEITNSQGITRGKNDKLDAKRIAKYAYKNREDIRIHSLPSKAIRQLKILLSYRNRVVKASHTFRVSSKEIKAFENQAITKRVLDGSEVLIKQCKEELKGIEKEIDRCIGQHPELKQHYDLLLSVPGIGRQNALHMIVYTKNFVCFSCPKKFASYAGIAPFEHSSGKRVNKKAKVSQKANKKMKALLSSAVVVSLKHCTEYRMYYEKQLSKGKNEYSVKNVIRNKIVSRAFAVIKRNSPYVNIHAFAS